MTVERHLVTALLVGTGFFCNCTVQTIRAQAPSAATPDIPNPSTQLPAPLRTIPVDPSMSYCRLLNSAIPGDEYIFAGGTYRQPCHFSASGTSAAPIVVRSANPSN